MDQSRRDDLESIGFILVYLATGTLPWIEELDQADNMKQEVIVAKCLHIKQTVTS